MIAKRRIRLWVGLVLLNAVVGLVFSLTAIKPIIDSFAIFCGVLTFMIIYIEADYWLGRHGKEALRRRLVISAIIRAGIQVLVFVDLYAGFLAMLIVEGMIGAVPFLSVYLAVLIDGFLLSVLVALLMLVVGFVGPFVVRWKNRRVRD